MNMFFCLFLLLFYYSTTPIPWDTMTSHVGKTKTKKRSLCEFVISDKASVWYVIKVHAQECNIVQSFFFLVMDLKTAACRGALYLRARAWNVETCGSTQFTPHRHKGQDAGIPPALSVYVTVIQRHLRYDLITSLSVSGCSRLHTYNGEIIAHGENVSYRKWSCGLWMYDSS